MLQGLSAQRLGEPRAEEVLRSSPVVLLGVGPGAAHALSTPGIHTVFDLAGSSTFEAAATVLHAVADSAGDGAGNRALPADLFTTAPSGSVESVPD